MRPDLLACRFSIALVLMLTPVVLQAGDRTHELLMSWGTGPQQYGKQHNSQVAVDYNFYMFRRSARSGISLGAGYTRLWTDAGSDRRIDAFSLYPQLTLWPVMEALRSTYFFVRALGPSYISNNRLGSRQQSRRFAFQAQTGVGYRRQLNNERAVMIQVSWKHFSNANLFSDNDGIDIPFVLTLGLAF